MLSKQALEVIALVFSDSTLRLPPDMWRAGAEVRDWAARELKAEADQRGAQAALRAEPTHG